MILQGFVENSCPLTHFELPTNYNIVTHDNNGITIAITNIPAELIQTLKQNFGDGLTIEIHSYCTTNDIWEQLSKSRVVSVGKPCTVNGQIHSALRPDPDDPAKEEMVPIYYENK